MCKLRIPEYARNAKSITMYIRRIYWDWEIQNETRWVYNFNLTKMNNDIGINLLNKFQYSLSKEVHADGDVEFNASFRMKNKTVIPKSVSVDFTGINMDFVSSAADVRFTADDQGPTDNRVSFQTKKRKYRISSNVTIDSSLCQPTGGTRGFMYLSATFQVDSYLTITVGHDVGREIYEMNRYHLFPYGIFAMLKPKNNQQIYLTPGERNIIPCRTIGAHRFNMTLPKLYRFSENGTWYEASFPRTRKIIGLYFREESALIGPGNVP